MASSGAQSIAIDECMDLAFVGEIARQQHIGFIGNLHVTSALFEQTENPTADTRRCLDSARDIPGYVFGLGGPITQHIDTERLDEAIAEYYQSRQR